MENGVRLVRIPHKEPKVKKPQVSYTLPTYSEKRPVILCGFDLNTVFVRPIDENSSINFEKLQHEIDNHVARGKNISNIATKSQNLFYIY